MTTSLRKHIITSAAAMSFATPVSAADMSSVFPFAATGTIAGIFGAYDANRALDNPANDPFDIGAIVAGGQFVIPLSGHWNLQLGGQWRNESVTYDLTSSDFTYTSFDATVAAFWRDPFKGSFGFETGLFSTMAVTPSSFKIGGLAEYYWHDQATITAYGGALLVFADNTDRANQRYLDGFYAGSRLTWYAADTIALSANFTWHESALATTVARFNKRTLAAGGAARYLTSMQGVELFAAAHYVNCQTERPAGNVAFASREADGAEFTMGVNIRLGGRTDSLVAIDRSNAIDTSFRTCDAFY